MQIIPEIVPLAEMQSRLVELLKHLPQAPVILTQNDRAQAVLVSPEAWNELVGELEDLRDALDALHAYEAYQEKPEAVRSWREIRAELVAEGRLDE